MPCLRGIERCSDRRCAFDAVNADGQLLIDRRGQWRGNNCGCAPLAALHFSGPSNGSDRSTLPPYSISCPQCKNGLFQRYKPGAARLRWPLATPKLPYWRDALPSRS